MDRTWIAFFSQTGKEISDLAKEIGRWPDVIVTNERPLDKRKIDSEIENKFYVQLSNTPTVEEYEDLLGYYDKPLITLHGWLRIIPEEVCERYEMYNGHPGLISIYPELKGKDPQIRAYEGDYEYIGSVIHRVTPGVDEGEINYSIKVQKQNWTLDETFLKFRELSLDLWKRFLIGNFN